MDSVYKFALLADKGIKGAIKTEKSFGFNRDVTIYGSDLLKFIKTEYTELYDEACINIVKLDKKYKVSAFDLS